MQSQTPCPNRMLPSRSPPPHALKWRNQGLMDRCGSLLPEHNAVNQKFAVPAKVRYHADGCSAALKAAVRDPLRVRSSGGRRFVTTANAMTGDWEGGLAAGMDGCISKPARLEALWGFLRTQKQ